MGDIPQPGLKLFSEYLLEPPASGLFLSRNISAPSLEGNPYRDTLFRLGTSLPFDRSCPSFPFITSNPPSLLVFRAFYP